MITRHEHNSIIWVDCQEPTSEEIRGLVSEFAFDPVIGNELLTETVRSRVEKYDNAVYVIMRFPSFINEEEVEIDFVIGKDFLITTRYGSLDSMHNFSKMFEVDSILDKSNMAEHAGYIFFYMIRELYRGLSDQLEVLKSVLSDIETNIFKGKEREMVVEISHINRKLLRFRSSLEHHSSILESYEVVSKNIFGEEYNYYARAIVGEYHKIAKTLDHMYAYLAELRSTNDSLLSTKQNEIMKNLTIMAFVAFPMTVIASVFGMNAKYMPLIGQNNDFWLIVIIMTTLALFTFIFFKYKKWF